MTKFFECTVKIERLDESGARKIKTEKHVVNALSFTEAEARITKELEAEVTGGFVITSIRAKKYEEILRFPEFLRTPVTDSPLDKWFEMKVNYLKYNEDGREKKIPVLYLIQAGSVNVADGIFIYSRIGTLSTYRVEKISETRIVEVFDAEPGKSEGTESTESTESAEGAESTTTT